LTEITVKVSTMRLLQPSAEAKIRELDVSSGIQEQIVRLNVPAQNPQQIKLPRQLLCSRTRQYILPAVMLNQYLVQFVIIYTLSSYFLDLTPLNYILLGFTKANVNKNN